MFRNSTSTFDKLLDKATSNLRLEPDWPTILQLCDLIRQGDCPPKYALAGVKKKMFNSNPHISMFALLVLESMVKNCGHLIHDEVATKSFMDQLKDLAKTSQHEQCKQKVLEMIQTWAYAFRSVSKYRAVQEILSTMKTEGFKFPVLKESDAMFSADLAPEWVDDVQCHRCRTSFGVVVRKHHCRACGNVFCGNCSSKISTIPKFGIEKEVRVCDTCYDSLNRPRSTSPHSKSESETLPAEYLSSSLAQQSQTPKAKEKSSLELKEEEELQLALALSQSEAEAKEKEKKKYGTVPKTQNVRPSTPPQKEDDEEDPELARYLNRSYWEQKQNEEKGKKRASPEQMRSSPGGPPSAPTTPTHKLTNGEMSDTEMDEFVAFLKGQVEVFVNRMKSNASRGRSIATDSSIQTLFMNVAANHSKLLKYIHQQDDLRVHYEGLQDKLTQVKDARAALDALREEYREKLRREAEEAERQKQMQMAQKLHIMRKKKQEYLQYQRQLALQKVQEQEREMQIRQEQQKQQYLMGNMGMHSYMQWGPGSMDPNMAMPGQYPGYMPQHYQNLPPGVPEQQGPPGSIHGHPPGIPQQGAYRPAMQETKPPVGSLPPQMMQQRGPPGVYPQPQHGMMISMPGQQMPHNYQGVPIQNQQNPQLNQQGQKPQQHQPQPPGMIPPPQQQGMMPPQQQQPGAQQANMMPPQQQPGMLPPAAGVPYVPHNQAVASNTAELISFD